MNSECRPSFLFKQFVPKCLQFDVQMYTYECFTKYVWLRIVFDSPLIWVNSPDVRNERNAQINKRLCDEKQFLWSFSFIVFFFAVYMFVLFSLPLSLSLFHLHWEVLNMKTKQDIVKQTKANQHVFMLNSFVLS